MTIMIMVIIIIMIVIMSTMIIIIIKLPNNLETCGVVAPRGVNIIIITACPVVASS